MNAISNGIQKRQNEAANIAKLKAADRLYNETKRLNFLEFLFAVILPFLFSCIDPYFQSGGKFVTVLPHLLSIISMLLSFLLKPVIDAKITLAADIKQDFDVSVYQMPWNRDLFGEKRNLTREIAENSAMGRSDDAFQDWYRPEADASPLKDGIFECQRENYAWDDGLRGRYKTLCIWGLVGLITLIIFIELFKESSVVALLASLAFIVPILSWLLKTVGALNADLKRLEDMKASFQSADVRTMKDLQIIQKSLHEHRKKAVIPPGFLYRMYRDNDEEKARQMIEMAQWGKRDGTDSL